MTTALDVCDRIMNQFRIRDTTCDRHYDGMREDGAACASVRHWLYWENPADASDEQDYDWQVPTDYTRNELAVVIMTMRNEYPTFDIDITVGEKNHINIEVKEKTMARTRTKPAEAPAAAPEVALATDKELALVSHVKDWATQNRESKVYDWDRLLETQSDEELVASLREAEVTTKAAALTHFRKVVKLWAEQRAEHAAEAEAGK